MNVRRVVLALAAVSLALASAACSSSGSGAGGSSGSGGGSGCTSTSGSGTAAVCTFRTSDDPSFGCSGGEKTGTCSSKNLFGCCTTTMAVGSHSLETSECYYDKAVAASMMKGCNSAMTKWSSSVP